MIEVGSVPQMKRKIRTLDENSDGGTFYDMFTYEADTIDLYEVRRFYGVKFFNNFICLSPNESAPYTVVLYIDNTCVIHDVWGNLRLKYKLNICCKIS